MKVIDISYAEIDSFCQEVADKIELLQKPFCVVGIADGGTPISDNLWSYLKDSSLGHSYLLLKCTRPSTKKKKAKGLKEIIQGIFKILPKFVLNWLRILEHQLLMDKKSGNKDRYVEYEKWIIQNDLIDTFLLVDDAIDSGNSLLFVKNHLLTTTSIKNIKTAVIVTTHTEPVIKADYQLHSNVLIRFPWSMDS